MSIQIIPFTTEQAWLEARTHDITSTEIAALFNVSPYLTPFELYHAKRDSVVELHPDSARMRWGRRLQNPIAFGVAEDLGLAVHELRDYMRVPEARIGSPFDFKIVQHPRGDGLMEIKTVDHFAFKDNWLIEDGEALEAPAHIELQVQHQLHVSGLRWAMIVALVGGNRVSLIERTYDEQIGRAIVKKAQEFWQLVDQGTPPSPDYTRDAELLAHLYLESTAGKTLDARDDVQLGEWVEQHKHLGEAIRDAQRDRDALKARILERITDASRVLLPYGSLSCGTVRESVVPQHVRGAYRNLRFTQPKESK